MKHQNELYVPIPVDVDAVKNKILFGLTLRQIVCFGVGILLGIGVYFGIKNFLGTSIAGLIMIAVMLPSFFFAVYEKNGEPLEVTIRRIWQMKGRPTKRPYRMGGGYVGTGRASCGTHRKNSETEPDGNAVRAENNSH